MNRLRSFFAWLPAALAVLWAAASFLPPKPADGFDLGALGRLPVMHEGRLKPLDTAARASLLAISGKQSLDDGGKRATAVEWLLDLATRPQKAEAARVFLIDDPGVLGLLGIEPQGRYYSYGRIKDGEGKIMAQAEAAASESGPRSRFQSAVLVMAQRLRLFQALRSALPPADGSAAGFPVIGPAFPEEARAEQWNALLQAWGDRSPERFNAAARALAASARDSSPETAKIAGREYLFNRLEPFYKGLVLYLAALLLFCASWLSTRKETGAAAWRLLLVALGLHTAGIIFRVFIEGRPPVTNLYSSAVFVGWAAVLAGALLDRFYRRGSAAAAAAVAGFITLLVAHNLAAGGDTMEAMRAVLDSNFWLATHVVTIVIGYSGTYLAALLAHVFIFRGLFDASFGEDDADSLTRMVYGIIAFSLVFTFIGTVLGGIWADRSWGRFWGWDPKENGALLLVLWNASILHARSLGIIRRRGLMVCCVLGGVLTTFCWFGVNMLGVGMHAYGNMESGAAWLAAFACVEGSVALSGFLWTRLDKRRTEEVVP